MKMKTIVKLLLIYLGFQLIAGIIILIPTLFLLEGDFSSGAVSSVKTIVVIGILILSSLLMSWYLYVKNYFRKDRHTWSVVSWRVFPLFLLSGLSAYVVALGLNDLIGLPNLMEEEFVDMSNNVWGILGIVLIGPFAEELLFRGAILGGLLKKMDPKYAVLISALIFGVIHFNPAQIIFAFLVGLLLGYVYYSSGSLLLPILIHVIINGISTGMTLAFPDVETFDQLFGEHFQLWAMSLGTVLFIVCQYLLRPLLVIPDWKEAERTENESEASMVCEEIKE